MSKPKIKVTSHSNMVDTDTWYFGAPTQAGVYERNLNNGSVIPTYARWDGSRWYQYHDSPARAGREQIESLYQSHHHYRKVKGETYV